VLLKVVMDLPDGPHQEITKEAYPRHLQLLSEHKSEKASSSGIQDPEEAPEGSAARNAGTPQWLVGSSDPSCVKKEPLWRTLLCDSDACARMWHLRSRIGVGMEALSEVLPNYCEKDLVLAHRKSDKGVWRDELWTNREFQPFELLLAPHSSQLKDTHLMTNCHAVVGIPKHGRGKHPEDLNLALDGRSRTSIAKKGSIDDHEHIGSLYWLVHRTSNPSDANMVFENIAWEQKISMTLPGNKKRKVSTDWGSSELPTIPLLVNKKIIAKHCQLLMFEKKDESKKDVKEKKPKKDEKK
jgi:hypothetical protein